MNDVEAIRKKMGRWSEPEPRLYLDTGSKELNGVLGDPDKGIFYGEMLEIAGMPSAGKTGLMIDLATTAQADTAHVIWADFENSFDRVWAGKRGLKCGEDEKTFSLVQPYLIEAAPLSKDGKPLKKKPGKVYPKRMVHGEELIEEIEALMALHHKRGAKKQILFVDSVKAISPKGESALLSKQNLVTKMSLPELLGRFVKKWTGLAATYNVIVVFINQLREKPMAFGDPSYTPGGNAIPFHAHVRVRVKRSGTGKIKKNNRMVGVVGIMVNTKNKAGGTEADECGFRFYFDGRSKFTSAQESKDLGKKK